MITYPWQAELLQGVIAGRYNKDNTRKTRQKKKGAVGSMLHTQKIPENNSNGFLRLRRWESQFATPSDTTELETEKGYHFLNANNLLRE